MDAELPSDWGTARRATASSPPPESPDARALVLAQPTQQATNGKRRASRPTSHAKRARSCTPARQPDGSGAQPSGAVDGSQAERPQSPPPASQPEDQQSVASTAAWGVSPLGPRSVFDAATNDAPERGQLRDMVMANLLRESDRPPTGEHDEIEVDCLLCKLPYKKMLNDLYGHTAGVGSATALRPPQIQYVTRAYEESFMREPMHPGERKCPKGRQCECMHIDAENQFVGVEFLLPGERPPATPHMCVLCCRAVTQQLYYDVMFDKQDFGGVIQRFGNIHSQAGEYALDAMLISAPNAPVHVMPLPIVAHQRNRYSVYMQGGIRYLKQSRVYFQDTPS